MVGNQPMTEAIESLIKSGDFRGAREKLAMLEATNTDESHATELHGLRNALRLDPALPTAAVVLGIIWIAVFVATH